MPCTNRPTISMFMLPATPQISPPSRKTPMANCSTTLRPYMSPSLPAIGAPTVDASRKAVTTQEI